MLVINAGTILTGNNLLPKTAHSIIIEGETISRIIPTSSVPEGIRKSAENLEWTDLTIMPRTHRCPFPPLAGCKGARASVQNE